MKKEEELLCFLADICKKYFHCEPKRGGKGFLLFLLAEMRLLPLDTHGVVTSWRGSACMWGCWAEKYYPRVGGLQAPG
jgi:hypothetical protein